MVEVSSQTLKHDVLVIDGGGLLHLSIDSMLHSSPREGLGQELGNNIEYNLAKFIYIADVRGEATNSGLGGQVQIGNFFVS